jgi:hypothetical protein
LPLLQEKPANVNTNYQCKYNNEKKKKTIIREYDNNHNERQQPATWSSTAC